MLARCIGLLIALSGVLFAAFAATGEGPLVAVKERRTVVMGAAGELAPGAATRGRLALLDPASNPVSMLPSP